MAKAKSDQPVNEPESHCPCKKCVISRTLAAMWRETERLAAERRSR